MMLAGKKIPVFTFNDYSPVNMSNVHSRNEFSTTMSQLTETSLYCSLRSMLCILPTSSPSTTSPGCVSAAE